MQPFTRSSVCYGAVIPLLHRHPAAYVAQLVGLQEWTHKYLDVKMGALLSLVGDDELCLLKCKKKKGSMTDFSI